MPSAEPSSQMWIVRLKYRSTTVMLHADPVSTVDTLKKELLVALKETCPDGMLEGEPLPESHEAFILAQSKDKHDARKGWDRLDPSSIKGLDDEEQIGRKKRRKSSVERYGATPLKETGMRDDPLLAFKWRPNEKTELGDGFDILDESDDEFDVVLPTFDDEMDEGL
ncbi:hypothetical protein BDY21DRAFT_378680 [Lineolata rhizophorae]|uniref:Uncharacterized protein n=1 Tax=Lineolata rhizophorae TaxID=578093 RepID=A0A6A6P3D0_9PEZI|nr:hypothetical protein BDY21DRAFT_378680 [Lineolata rhizophorae]